MDDRETELSRFRQQWKEEVTARHTAPPPSSSSSSSKAKAPASAFSARKLSHSSSNDVTEEDAIVSPPESSVRERSVSPTAVRRTSVSIPGVPESALEHYERAVEKETQGSLGESLSLYRKAFRMDAKVDTHYREKYFPRPPPTAGPSKEKPTSTPAPAPPPILASNSKQVSTLISSFAHLTIQPITPTEETPISSPLSSLPPELLLHILRSLAITDLASFTRCAQVCKALAYLVTTEQSLWHDICTTTYKPMLWDWICEVDGTPLPTNPPSPPSDPSSPDEEEEELEKRVIPTDDDLLPIYSNNWYKMLTTRPRIRFNGIYISTCNYVRSGASQSGWNTPVHIVTYYRYLRFYPDGTVLSLLTTTEPGEVVHGFSKVSLTPAHLREMPGTTVGAWGRYVSRGRWRMDPEGRVDVETGGSVEKYFFRMQLRVKSVRAGGRLGASNKLVWEGFWSWNKLTDDLAEFSLRNDKAFFFSRVGSVEREMGV